MAQSNKNLTLHHAHTLRLGEMTGWCQHMLEDWETHVDISQLDARSQNIYANLKKSMQELINASQASAAMLNET